MDVRQILELVAGAVGAADVVSGWLATYALHSTVWILLAWWLTSRGTGRLSPRVEHAAWTVALCGGFATAAVQLAGVHLAGGLTPLAGQVRLLEGRPDGSAPLRLLVRRDADNTTHFSFGWSPVAPLAPPSPFASLPSVLSWAPFAPAGAHAMGAPWGVGADPVPLAALERAIRIVRFRGALRAPLAAAVAPLAASSGAVTVQAAFVAAPWPLALVALWVGAVALLLARFAVARSRLAAMLRDRVDARSTLAGNALRELARSAGVTRELALSVTNRFASPAALPGGEICLPRRVLSELTLREQESLLAHELAHVVRCDTTWRSLAGFIECVAWFQPLNRLAVRRMQLAAEFAADEWAVRLTREPLQLARCLARVAGWLTPGSATLAPALSESRHRSPFVERVRRLTRADPIPAAGRPGATVFTLALAGAALVAVPPSLVVGRAAGSGDHLVNVPGKRLAIIVRRDTGSAMPRALIGDAGLGAAEFDVLRFVTTSPYVGE